MQEIIHSASFYASATRIYRYKNGAKNSRKCAVEHEDDVIAKK